MLAGDWMDVTGVSDTARPTPLSTVTTTNYDEYSAGYMAYKMPCTPQSMAVKSLAFLFDHGRIQTFARGC